MTALPWPVGTMLISLTDQVRDVNYIWLTKYKTYRLEGYTIHGLILVLDDGGNLTRWQVSHFKKAPIAILPKFL